MSTEPERARYSDGIDVVVVAYGPPDLLQRCLACLEGRYRVIVVDNSSSLATRVVVEEQGALYLDPGENVGFAAAVNIALERRRTTCDVLLLNPDATIEPTAIELLQAALRSQTRLACVAPAQHRPGSEVRDRVSWPFPGPARAWLEAIGLGQLAPRRDFLIGSILLLRAAAVDDIGPLDERFFLYAEEADWQRRAAHRGWTVELVEHVVAEHVGAATGGDPRLRELRFQAAQERYVRKWHGSIGWQIYRLAIVAGAMARAIAPRRERRELDWRRARTYFRGPVRDSRESPHKRGKLRALTE